MKPAILILGATGAVGQGVVQAAVRASWPVVAVARDGEALDRLRSRFPEARIQTLVASVADDESAEALVDALRKLDRPFAGVVAALGAGSERGRVLDQSADQLRHAFDDAVLPHLVAARHLLPWLGSTGRNCGYVVIGGPGGRHPWAGYGHRSVTAAAVSMLARVLHVEARRFSVRLQLLEVESPVRTDDNDVHACKQWPCVEAIGRKALSLIAHRNDARCTDAVIDYRDDACGQGDNAAEALTVEQHQAPPSPTTPERAIEPQEMDSRESLLPARCLQDVHKLLDTFTPTKKKQERTR